MEQYNDGIAIIGMSCRFPGANSLEKFWDNLVQNKEAIHFFSDEELKNFEYDFERIKDETSYVRARGIIEDIDKWDANFFGRTPYDARILDPQHRLWLSNTWHAFEDAGINPFNYEGKIGVYAGSVANTYLLNNVLRDPEKYELYLRTRTPAIFQTYIDNEPMFLATRTAYFYNLRGPAISLQTACSTSLVAVAQACNSLFSHESDVCVAGGVTVTVPQETGYIYQEGAIQSPDGHCRPFDKDSKGTVFANGVGTVVLKRLEDAVKDNDRVYAVLRGWAVNNDGHAKIGFTAPGIEGQREVISAAYSFAGIRADEICYIEAHGTATPLGDPIEVKALTQAFSETTSKKQFCGIGSVKSNIGHLDAAAGVAGLIKAALSAYNKVIPATLHFKAPNPLLNIKDTPFFVVDKNIEWTENKPMNIGISSLGVGGTNAHVLLSGYQIKQEKPAGKNHKHPALFVLSAKSEKSLTQMQNNLISFIDANKKTDKHQIAASLQLRRAHFPVRSYILSGKEAGTTSGRFKPFVFNEAENKIVFLFPGQGAQYAGMGKNIYDTEDVCKRVMDSCFSIYQTITGIDIKPIIFESGSTANNQLLAETRYTQPALFIIEYALAQLYMHFGIKPDYCLGHSIGEYTAACVAGVFDMETALKIVIKRGELMFSAPRGNMMAVFASDKELRAHENGLFEIAAINSPSMITISYQGENEDRLLQILDSNEYKYVRLNTSHGFHSKAFEPIMKEFTAYVNSFHLKKPQKPFVSCLTGDFITDKQATSGDYWSSQLRNSVLFSKGIQTLSGIKNPLFIELGPNTHLRGLVMQNDALLQKDKIICSLGKLNELTDQERVYQSLGELWIRGIEPDFTKFHNPMPEHVSLPLYAFEKNRYWIDFKLAGDVQISDVSSSHYNNVSKLGEVITQKKNVKDSLEAIEDEVREMWCTLFGINDIKKDDDFFKIGGSSILALNLVNEIEKKYKCTMSFRDFLSDYNSVRKMSFLIWDHQMKEAKQTSEAGKFDHLYCLCEEGNKPPVFTIYSQNIVSEDSFLKSNHPIYGFSWPLLKGNRLEMESVEEIAEKYLKEIKIINPTGPFILVGFSFGGLVAMEIASMLQKESKQVALLMLIDSTSILDLRSTLSTRFKQLKKQQGFIYSIFVSAFIKLPKVLWSQLLAFGLRIFSKRELDPEQKLTGEQTNELVLHNILKLARKYKPQKIHGEIVLIKKDDPKSDPYLGWKKYCDSVTVHEVEGDHMETILLKRNKEKITNIIYEYLDNKLEGAHKRR
ncbi:beta-ketoacyl synthase N-terminal-like domain-containing protein [Saccharicrinis sp. FJH54]|uniref:type I polyketide synthase n=1 Tax=Saccharicrinis sp. FJH54 TaxID=3344665 RepID=UPI0035D44091